MKRWLLIVCALCVGLLVSGISWCDGQTPMPEPELQPTASASAADSVEVISPNGSERWLVGSIHNITWTATLSSELVKIEYSSNGGTSWSIFKVNTPNDGTETWIVPYIPSAFCLVRVSDAIDGSPSDTSDGPFRVEPAGSVPLITTKTPGEVFVSFVGGDSAADSEIGFGYASETTPPQYRYILFQGLPDYPNPATELSLGFMSAGSELDFYIITLGVAAYSGFRLLPNPKDSFWDIDNSKGWGGTIVQQTSVAPETYLLHLDRATGGIDDDNDFLIQVKIVPTGPSPPVAVVQTPAGVQSGNVTIFYALKDSQGDACWISVHFSDDGGMTWKIATQGPGGDGTTNLTSSTTGRSHIFVWDSLADIGQTRQDDIQIRITPFDTESGQGTPSSTSDFVVDNLPPPQLSCSPGSLTFQAMEGGPDPARQLIEVWNSGGGPMDWRVVDNAPWLIPAPTVGQSAGERDAVTVSAAIAGLTDGVYDAVITVSSPQLPGTIIQVPVRLTILEPVPVLSVSPQILNFSTWEGGENPPSQDLQIQNVGGHDMPWQVWGDRDWLTLSPESGRSLGEIDTVVVFVDVTGLGVGSYAAQITVSAPGAVGSRQYVPVLLEVTEPPPLLSVTPTLITFTCTEEENPGPEYIVITNAGTGEFDWQVSDDAEWLSASPLSGNTAAEADAIQVRADVTGLSPGTYPAKITVTATTVNSPQNIDVTLVVKEKPPTISVSPTPLHFSAVEGEENPPPQQLRVKNSGRRDMDWQASGDRAWLGLSPHEGTSSGEEDAIEVAVDIAGLAAGSYSGRITVTSAVAVNSPVVVPVLLEISEPPPKLSVSPEELVFSCTEGGDNPSPQHIEIRNVGTGEFTWEVSDDAAWLSLAPISGTTAGEVDSVQASVDIAGLPAGTHTATITVGGTAHNAPQSVSVSLVIAEPPPAVLDVTPLSLYFATVEGEGNPPPQEIRVRNAGGRDMEWHVLKDAPWLSASPESGSNTGEEDVVDVFVDVSELSPGTYWGTLTVMAAGATNSPQSVQVRLAIEENPPVLAVSPLSLSFEMEERGAEPEPQSFSIWNEGGRAMDWQVSVDETWVRVMPESGTNTGSPDVVQVSIVGEGMGPGGYTAGLKVEAPDADNSPRTVWVTLTVKAVNPEIHVWPEQLDFVTTRGGGNPPSKTFRITTRFHEAITWLADEDADWLSVSPSTDTNQGEEDAVTVSVDKTGLDLGTFECDIVVRDVLRPTFTASVRVLLRIEPIRVPEDYPTIQAAMDAAEKRDVILVREGTYRGRVRMKPYVELLGEGAERTVIDCEREGTAVAFDGLGWARLDGFTIKGGIGEDFGRGDRVGGGIYIFQSSPRISACRVVNNSAVYGGGICLDGDSSPELIDCEICDNASVVGGGLFFYEESSATILTTKISGNSAEWYGGGLYLGSLSSASLRSCELSHNEALYDGGAIHGALGCQTDIVSCTLVGNASPEGAAVFMEASTSLQAANTIIWGNSSPMVLLGGNVFRYCDVEEGDMVGQHGNVSSDPLFAAAEDADYHLLPASPCLDRGSNLTAGLPATDLDGEARIMEGPLGAVTDIGADEVNPDMPAVLVEEVSPEENGLVSISYSLCHVRSEPCSVLVEYSLDAGRTWHKATRAIGGEGTFGLSSSPGGQAHAFVWDSIADVGGMHAVALLLRVTPQAAAIGKSRLGQPFSLDNTTVDTDDDRLPDTWEQTIIDANLQDAIRSLGEVSGEDDFDGDRMSNRGEYLAGTSPVDGQSYLRLLCTSGMDGEAIVSWPSVEGRMYRLLYCDGMGNGWHVLGEVMAGTGSWMESRDATAMQTALRFYRIEME